MTPLYLRADQIAHLLRIPVGTLYRWAHEDEWPRTRTRPIRYRWSAARASATRRGPRKGAWLPATEPDED